MQHSAGYVWLQRPRTEREDANGAGKDGLASPKLCTHLLGSHLEQVSDDTLSSVFSLLL